MKIMKIMASKFTLSLLTAAGLVVASAASADALTLSGVLNVNGGVRVTTTTVDFTPVGGGSGLENIEGTTTFRVNGELVTACANCIVAKDIDGTLFPVTGFEEGLDFYEQLDQFPDLNFQLQDVLSCLELEAGECTLGETTSAFAFDETALGTEVVFGVTGLVFTDADADGIPDVGDPDVYSFLALYTAQFPGLDTEDILASFLPGCVPGEEIPDSGGQLRTCGFIETSFSASKIAIFQENPVVPEPATLLLLGTGLVGAAARARRRRNTSV